MRLAFAILAVISAFAQPNANQKLMHLEGRVVHSVSGAGIPRASVRVMPVPQAGGVITTTAGPQESNAAATDGERKFSVDLTPGTYSLTASRSGFASLPASVATVKIDAGQTPAPVELKLAPGAVITVLVLDENGDPVERAMVQAGVYRFLSGRRIFTNSSANSTNDLGEARISGIAGGTYFLSASAPLLAMQGMVPARKPGQNYDESLALTFYPGVTQREQALPVQVGSGRETQVTLRMQKGRTYRVRGELPTAASDSPRSQVMLFPLRDPMDLAGMNSAMRTIMPKADGKFEVAGVLPGRYQLVVGRGGSSPFQNSAASALVEVRDGDVDGVMPQPVRPVTIRGRVRFEGDDQTGVAGLRVVLQSVEGMPTALNTGNPPVTAADGTFIVEGLMPGRYQIRTLGAPSAPGTYLKAIRLGTTDATSTPLDLTADNPPAIEIVYSRKAAKVEATVSRIDDKRPWGVALLVPDPWVPDPMALNGVPRLSTVAQGVATWTNVPPGKYRAYAIEQAELLMAIDPEILSKLESRGAAINVGEGETARATVKQIAPEELERQ